MTEKQRLWDDHKASVRLERLQQKLLRNVRGPISQRVQHICTCAHAPKHHKKTGHCRPGCNCGAGVRRYAS